MTKKPNNKAPFSKSSSYSDWRSATYAAQRERLVKFNSISFREQPEIVTPENGGAVDYHKDLGYPGEYPFTRGIQPTMYRGRLWTMRQFAGFGTPEDTNQRFKYLLDHGQTGLSTAFDMPSLMGYDPDHPRSLGEVGRGRVAESAVVNRVAVAAAHVCEDALNERHERLLRVVGESEDVGDVLAAL